MSLFNKIAKWVAVILAAFILVMISLSRRPGAGRNEYSVVIDRPPAEVFPWLIEPHRLTRWLDGLESSTPVVGDSAVKGAKSREVIAMDGQRFTLLTEIMDIRKDSLLSVHITSEPAGYTINATYELTPTGAGTKLHYVGHAGYAGIFMGLMEPLITPQGQKKIEADMKRLKELIEAQPGAPGI